MRSILLHPAAIQVSALLTFRRNTSPKAKKAAAETQTVKAYVPGDSYNDLGMIKASKAGFLFRSTVTIKAEHPEIPAYETFEDLSRAIKAAL